MGEPAFTLMLYTSLALIAMLYSSVGHGGASGYLAVFGLFGVLSPDTVPLVLIMNICVASVSFWNYWKGGHFNIRLLLPFVVASVPASYVGGWISVSLDVFSLILGVALVLAAVRILLQFGHRDRLNPPDRATLWRVGVPSGTVIGFLSGMIGIGGGVFLSPLILLLGWADTRRTAAVASAFIALNSFSGLLGHMGQGRIHLDDAIPFLAVVCAGGLAGSYLGTARIHAAGLRGVLALVLVMAAVKLFAAV